MINKKSLWFLTLFSLILVLSIYYITMPNELLLTNIEAKEDKEVEPTISNTEEDLLTSLRVNADEKMNSEVEELQLILENANATPDEKSSAYDKIKNLNSNRAEEEKLEGILAKELSLKSFVKIEDGKISVTLIKEKPDDSLANKIMRTIQKNYENSKYITVTFKNS